MLKQIHTYAYTNFKTVLLVSIVTQSTSHCSSLNIKDVQKLHTDTTQTYYVTSEVPKAIRIRTELQSSGLRRRVVWMVNRFSAKCLSLLVPWRWRQRRVRFETSVCALQTMGQLKYKHSRVVETQNCFISLSQDKIHSYKRKLKAGARFYEENEAASAMYV